MNASGNANTAHAVAGSSHASAPSPQVEIQSSPYGRGFRQCLAYVRSEAAGEVEGILGPRSLSWAIYRENALFAGGSRALLLQLAHPAVAEGVLQHSDFLTDPIGRARHTYSAMNRLLFGDLQAALLTAQNVFAIHARAHGVIQQETSAQMAGWPYHANDPKSRLWVYATMFDTFLLVYQGLIRRLSHEEKECFYQEGKLLIALNGVPLSMIPPDLNAFEGYFQQMLTGTTLEVGVTARAICASLFQVPSAPARVGAILPAGLLPSSLRQAYGLRWTSRQQRIFPVLWQLLRHTLVRLPPMLRFSPAYHLAMARIAYAQGMRPAISSRLIQSLGRIAPLPFDLLAAPGSQPTPRS